MEKEIYKINKKIQKIKEESQKKIDELEEQKQKICSEKRHMHSDYIKGKCNEEDFAFKIEYIECDFNGEASAFYGKYIITNGSPYFDNYHLLDIRNLTYKYCEYISKDEFKELFQLGINNIQKSAEF